MSAFPSRNLVRKKPKRKNYLFAGSDRGGECAADMYSLIETAKLNGLDSEAYLGDIVARSSAIRSASVDPDAFEPAKE